MNFGISSRKNTTKILAHIGAFVTVAAWGSSFLSTKILMNDGGFTPIEMFVYRFSAAYLLLLMFTFKNILSKSWRDEMTLALCGICSGSLYFITENYALTLTTTGNVSLLASLSPIFTTLLVAALYKQKLKAGIVTGSLVAFIGAGCIIFSHGDSLEIKPAGDLLAIAAALSWAVYTVAIKRILPLYSGFFVTRKLFFYGVLTAIPLLIMDKNPSHFNILMDFQNIHYLMNFVFLVVMCSLMAYLIWNEVMRILGPVSTNNYLYLQPLVTMITAYFFLGENIYMLGYVGCVLIIGGLVYSDKFPDGPMRRKL
ncbi:MAG: DMT family transporter [Candidatus Amulumruptor caecigallinarius]|nr:DMT family transporter [Candidatus Amulumruptor caecigallinarius]